MAQAKKTDYFVAKAFVLNHQEYKLGDRIPLTNKQAVFLELSGKISRNKPEAKQGSSK